MHCLLGVRVCIVCTAQIKLLKAYEKVVTRLIADTYDVTEDVASTFGADTHEHAYVAAKLRESGLDFLVGGAWTTHSHWPYKIEP